MCVELRHAVWPTSLSFGACQGGVAKIRSAAADGEGGLVPPPSRSPLPQPFEALRPRAPASRRCALELQLRGAFPPELPAFFLALSRHHRAPKSEALTTTKAE